MDGPYYISAYGLAVKHGFAGTETEWLESLIGPRGDTGKSAYQYAVEAGYEGSEDTFRESQLGNGKTAYAYAVEGGYTGSPEEFRKKLAAEYAPEDHDHDDSYAAKDHDHDDSYAAKDHDHDDSYAAKGHNHEGAYLEVTEGAVAMPLILVENVHYGATVPENPEVGRLYFIPVSEAVNL